MELLEMYAIATTVFSLVAASVASYVLYRKKEIVALAFEVIKYSKDDTKTEEEFLVVVNKLEAIINKK